MSSAAQRLELIDAIKAVASNLIVLHHLAFYGPMSDVAAPLLPDVFAWLAGDARIAVQAFLVIGGFLAARSLGTHGTTLDAPHRLLCKRYLKLALPFIVAMAIAVLASELARAWMRHDSISAPASLPQFAAHALLLHDIAGVEALSAGAWYVAIDFQLFALLLVLLYALRSARLGPRTEMLAVAALAAFSLWQWNLEPEWDAWAPYFFGSYALGVLAWRAGDRERSPWLAVGLILVLGGSALLVEFRSRIALAIAVALLLVLVLRLRIHLPGWQSAVLGWLGRISYGVFLVHFPISLVVNAAFTRFAPGLPEVQLVGVLLAWMASLAAGHAFHRWVEVPLGRWTGSGGRIATGGMATASTLPDNAGGRRH